MTPPPATPRKRFRHRFSDRDNIHRDVPSTPPRKYWREAMQDFMDAIPTLWHDMPPVEDPQLKIPNPENVLEGYSNLVSVLASVLAAADNTCRVIAEQCNLPYERTSLRIPSTLAPLPSHSAQESPEPEPEPEPEPQPEPQPEPKTTRPPQTYASIPASRTPPTSPSCAKGQAPPASKPLNLVRLVVQPKGSDPPPIRSIPAPEFFRRLTESCTQVPG
ncbi:hypothetical protein RSOL_527080, partial [Rhizoctonia solani AG-3 Rhs1AP]